MKVEWCPLNTELANAPEGGGVYLYPQVLALGLTFPVTSFMCYYHVTLSQLVAGDWRVVLSFQALCNLYLPDACRVEDFSALYAIKRTKKGTHFFGAKFVCEKLIVNLVDSNHEWRDTVIRVYGAWEAAQQRNHGPIQTVWNEGKHVHREIPITTEIEKRVQKLL